MMEKWNSEYSSKPEHGLAHHEDSFVIDNLSKIAEVPLLVIVGSEDLPFVNAASFLKSKLPKTQVEIIAGAGHLLVLSHKKEIRGFVDLWMSRLK
jgi:pimeloyl-ACP methyl ester carboxylesterase